jgi:hypothetical protein
MREFKISGFDDYSIREDGRVVSRKRGERLLKNLKLSNGYYAVNLINKEKRKVAYIHRLLGEYFLEKDEGDVVCHKDDVKTNNSLSNLYWGSRPDNWRDSVRNGHASVGEARKNAKLSNFEVRVIRRLVRESSIPQARLAEIYGVSAVTVSNIKTRKTWRLS